MSKIIIIFVGQNTKC